MGGRCGCELAHDPLDEQFRHLFGDFEGSHVRHDMQGLPSRVVQHPARSALAEVTLQFAAEIRRHIAVHVIAERGPNVFAAKHQPPPLAAK